MSPKLITMAAANVRLWSLLRNNAKKTVLHQQNRAILTSSTYMKDVVTHTGQVWDDSDRRLARFENTPKQVNPRHAIDFIAKVPPKEVKSRIVACDGGGGALGHPKVYINLDQPGNHTCGYCGLRFVKEDGHH